MVVGVAMVVDRAAVADVSPAARDSAVVTMGNAMQLTAAAIPVLTASVTVATELAAAPLVNVAGIVHFERAVVLGALGASSRGHHQAVVAGEDSLELSGILVAGEWGGMAKLVQGGLR